MIRLMNIAKLYIVFVIRSYIKAGKSLYQFYRGAAHKLHLVAHNPTQGDLSFFRGIV